MAMMHQEGTLFDDRIEETYQVDLKAGRDDLIPYKEIQSAKVTESAAQLERIAQEAYETVFPIELQQGHVTGWPTKPVNIATVAAYWSTRRRTSFLEGRFDGVTQANENWLR